MVADSYPHSVEYEGVCLEVKARFVTKKADNVQIAPDEEAADDDQGETVVDVIDGMRLKEVSFSKKDFMAVIKEFMAKMVAHLKENNEERIPVFKKNATEMVKLIVSRFDEF